MRTYLYGIIIAALALAVTGCKDDETGSDCTSEPPTGNVADGDYCEEFDECASGYCESFGHTPQDPTAVCAAAPALGEVHVTGNVTDFFTLAPIPNVLVEFSGALDVMQNPLDYPVYDTTTADGDGLVDVVVGGEATEVAVGVVVVVNADGYYPTGTGLVEPEAGCNVYPPGIRNHDIKLASEGLLTSWSAMLAADFPTIPENKLPIGDQAGVIGAIRYTSDGAGVSGATLQSRTDNSTALVYYLNEAEDGFVDDASTSNGFFVVLGPGIAEKFDAVIDGEVISRREATMGETNGVMFSTTVHVDDTI